MSASFFLRGIMGVALATGVIGVALLGIAFGYSLKPDAVLAFTTHRLFAPGLGCVIAGAFSGLLLMHIERAR